MRSRAYVRSEHLIESTCERISEALDLAEKGVPLAEAARAAHVSTQTLYVFARKSLLREAPAWIYERFVAVVGKQCDTCNELLLPGEWISRHDKYAGHNVVMFWCSEECLLEWDDGEGEAEAGMPSPEALREAAP